MRGWAPKGKRFYGYEQPYARGQRVSLIGAISTRGLVASMTVEGGMKSKDFIRFLKRLGPRLRKGQRVCMDNLQAHKSETVKKLIRSFGAEPFYLPTYSPDLNPIEAAWSKIKHFARKEAAPSLPLLRKAIRNAFRSISSADAQGFFRYCGYVGK